SRKPDLLGEDYAGVLVPIPVDQDLSSLSAIMLDDGYYGLLKRGCYFAGGLSCLKPEYLIVFKAKAWLDLRERKLHGEPIDSKKINKHKNDILRLYQILQPQTRISLDTEIASDMQGFISLLEKDHLPLNELGIKNRSVNEVVYALRRMFSLV
ncbi:MAG TPA: hypothetical protein P5533_04060, partial [Candidatus Cloacimonadota bacterium]|nr:hypothetical protein [Candidatus Cloacimonadota bacterium]